MMSNFGVKMIIMILMGLLMGAGHANVVPHNTPVFYDNDTLLAPNSHGQMTMYTIVDPTWELNIPGSPHDKIKVTGSANKVISYIDTHFPDYVWPEVGEPNITAVQKDTPDPYPKCNVFDLAPYPLAIAAQSDLKSLGNHFINLGKGPRTCAQVRCKDDLHGRHAAIWWCNDDSMPATTTASELADMAMNIIPTCAEFRVPMSWTHGQVFYKSIPWNVIVTGYEKCR